MTDLAGDRTVEARRADPAPGVPRPRDAPRPADPPSVFSDGVELTRLLARAQLTPAQAVELSVDVLAEAARREGATASAEHPFDPVRIGADGRVVRGGPAPVGRSAVGAVLESVADAVRPRAQGAGPAAERLLAELDRAAAEVPVTGVTEAACRLRTVADDVDRRAVRAEIGALVRAIHADPGAGEDLGAAGGTAADRPAPAWRATRARRRTAGRRAGAWLLSLVVLAGAVLLEVGFLRGHITADIGQLLSAGRGGATTSAAATPAQPSVAAPAPSSAGRVRAVDLRALAPCSPGAPCTVRVVVRLSPAAAQQSVTWSYRVTDLCTGVAQDAPGGAVSVPAGGEQAVAVGTVALPAARGAAVVAVTHQPATAASAAVTAGSCPARP